MPDAPGQPTSSPQSLDASAQAVGVVLGSMDATPLDFWVGVRANKTLQLDDLVVVETVTPDGARVAFYGIVDSVRKRFEGNQFDTDAFRVAAGTLPAEVSYAAHVHVTRVDPEVFVPPAPGDVVSLVRDEAFRRALYFDQMERVVPVGLTRSGEPVFANLEFLDGTRGAHASISGVSGVATKTTYATFLIYSLFHSGALGIDAANSKALIFNVKGEDLLWLDKPNARLKPDDQRDYDALRLPSGPFQSVAFFAPARRGSAVPIPDTGSRQDGVQAYAWTLREFAARRLLRFAFAGAEDARAQFHFVITRVERELERAAEDGDQSEAALTVSGTRVTSFSDLVDLLDTPVLDTMMAGAPVASGTLDAFRRRLHACAEHMGHLVSGHSTARRKQIDWSAQQVTVVDIHSLHSTAQMFVVGVLLKRMMEQKEQQGSSKPLVFVVLDELNKYAPREGWSPIRDVLLDIAERGRSLGVSLLGAQQTAGEVERRILANAAIKVVGRLDAAEADRGEYGFLTDVGRKRAVMLQPGSMIVSQPEIPMALLLRFPFPCWATRKSEVSITAEAPDPFARMV